MLTSDTIVTPKTPTDKKKFRTNLPRGPVHLETMSVAVLDRYPLRVVVVVVVEDR